MIFDKDLFRAFEAATATVNELDVLQQIEVVSKKEYVRFMVGEVENPLFKSRRGGFDLGHAEAALATCEALVKTATVPEVVTQLYQAKLATQLLRYQLIAASTERNDEKFFELSKKIHGIPKKKLFAQAVHTILATTPQSSSGAAALKKLRRAIGHVEKPKESLHVDMLPAPVVDTSPLPTAREVKKIFDDVLAENEIQGWQNCIDETSERTRFAVNPTQKTIFIPTDAQLQARSRPLTRIGAQALAEHEVGVHARRSYEGSQQTLQLLALGLSGHLVGEEGLASYMQQQIEGAKNFYGMDRYLAIGLVIGLDGTVRDFRSVFALMQLYYVIDVDNDAVPPEVAIRSAWEVCRRIFRGTTAQQAGYAYTRDLAYFEGNVGIWEYIVSHPERLPHLFIGKYNPLNKRHVESLQTLEILPQW